MIKKIGLVKGRHEIDGVTEYLFESVSDIQMFDYRWQRAVADKFFESLDSNTPIAMYVTGLTSCLVAFLDASRNYQNTVCLFHYNRETDKYQRQTFGINWSFDCTD
jgi:hypothetical protein